MGCDYHENIGLVVELGNNENIYILLFKEPFYFCFSYDEDMENDYEIKKAAFLRRSESKILYNCNGGWIITAVDKIKEYTNIIEKEFAKSTSEQKKTFDDIISIHKVINKQERY